LDKSSKENLVNDIENRLDDFFEEKRGAAQLKPNNKRLEKLKSIILSIDWEITDSCLNDLIGETNALIPQFESDRLTQTLLRMLNSLGRYIQKRKASAHPDAIKRIMSVFTSLEKLIDAQLTDIKEKERILAKEIVAFKDLKSQVEVRTKKTDAAAPSPSQPMAKPQAQMSTDEQFKFEKAVNEVEKRLTKEVQKLKEQLSTLQKEFDTLRKI
jgi:pilus assembly protein FimV